MAQGTVGCKCFSDMWPAYGVRHKRLQMAAYICICSTVHKGKNDCKAERLQPYLATLEALRPREHNGQ